MHLLLTKANACPFIQQIFLVRQLVKTSHNQKSLIRVHYRLTKANLCPFIQKIILARTRLVKTVETQIFQIV